MKLTSLVACGLLALIAAPASAATIIADDFESYADDTALDAVWVGPGTLDAGLGNPGKSLRHDGSASSNIFSMPAVAPGPGETLVFTADIYDDGTSANKRVTAGLRKASGASILEMGMYNSPSHYSTRLILFGSGNPNWVAFPNLVDDANQPISNAPVVGWHRYRAEITDSQVTFSLDLNSDGIINSTAVYANTFAAGNGFDVIRLGGPSTLSSPGGGANFDNVSLALVPEPASLALGVLALGGLGLLRGRRK